MLLPKKESRGKDDIHGLSGECRTVGFWKVNSLAEEDPGSPIAGMPVIRALDGVLTALQMAHLLTMHCKWTKSKTWCCIALVFTMCASFD